MTETRERFTLDDIAKRTAAIGSTFIEYEQTKKVHQFLTLMLKTGREMRRDPKRIQARVSLIEAPSSCGKSSAIDDFVATRNKSGERDILFIELPHECTVKLMTVEFLAALGDPLANKVSSTTAVNTRRIVSAIAARGISLIIIDEFQDLMNAQNERLATVSANWVKRILDKAKVPVICVGYPTMHKVIKSVEGLESRTGSTIVLKPLPWLTEHPEGTFEFRAFLREFERELNCADPSNLHAPDLAHAIHVATEGLVGQVAKLLMKGVEVSMMRDQGQDNITWDDFAEAFESLSPERENPFRNRNMQSAA